MATVGQVLAVPETSWERFQANDSNISYTSGWVGSGWHQVTSMYSAVESASFNFVGTKIRFISDLHPLYVQNCYISIDGIEYSYVTNGTAATNVLVFEMTGLPLKEHFVQIYEKDVCSPRLGLVFEAIDIDDSGKLKPYISNLPPATPAPTNLTAAAGNSNVTLSWNAVTNATGYNVKRSTIAGGPYTTIASNTSGTNYTDSTVTNGITYYYIVTALNSTAESTNSNEASAAPQGHGLLRITMSDSSEREYQLSDSEIAAFIAWCNRSIGTGNAFFVFSKTYNIGEFKNRKEYVMFEKIISFEVMELTK